jgi:hypothetical protein
MHEDKYRLENEILQFLLKEFTEGLYPETQTSNMIRVAHGVNLYQDDNKVRGKVGVHYKKDKINQNLSLGVDLFPYGKQIKSQWDTILQTNDNILFDPHPADYCLYGIKLVVQQSPQKMYLQLQDGQYDITLEENKVVRVPFLLMPCCYYETSPLVERNQLVDSGSFRVNGRTIPLQSSVPTKEEGMQLKLWYMSPADAVNGAPPAFIVKVGRSGPIFPNGLKKDPVKNVASLYDQMLKAPRATQNYGIPRSVFEQRAKQAIPSLVELAEYRDEQVDAEFLLMLLEEFLHLNPDPRTQHSHSNQQKVESDWE